MKRYACVCIVLDLVWLRFCLRATFSSAVCRKPIGDNNLDCNIANYNCAILVVGLSVLLNVAKVARRECFERVHP